MTPPGHNPYRPGAGIYPPFLAGRDVPERRVEDLRLRIEADGGGASPVVLVGVRGMGKTSLLLHFSDQLALNGWLVPDLLEFDSKRRFAAMWPGLRAWLATNVPQGGVPRARRWKPGPVTWNAGLQAGAAGATASVGASGSVGVRTGLPSTEELREDLFGVIGGLAQSRVKVALLFDETQAARSDELGLLAELGHKSAQERWPLLILFGGLPPLSSKLVKARSYASHFETMEIGPLIGSAPREALEKPAVDRGVSFSRAGLNRAVAFANGIPYHLQVIGQQSWERSNSAIGDRQVALAEPDARALIEGSMYRPLWDRASQAEQLYLVAMASCDRNQYGAAVREILERVGVDHPTGAQTRDRLIRKGLVHASKHGFVDFSYPGFATFAATQAAARPPKTPWSPASP